MGVLYPAKDPAPSLSLSGEPECDGGLAFGHVFVSRGIGPAIWTHAGADCAIQLVGPLT